MADDFDIRDFSTGGTVTVKAKEIAGKKYPAHILYDEAGAELAGLVTANPAANSILGRLKDIAGNDYEPVAASQTDQAMGATGALGDYLKRVVIVPATTAAGTVSIKDGSGSAINIFVSCTLADLRPIVVDLEMRSSSGGWKITTGLNVSAIGVGRFT